MSAGIIEQLLARVEALEAKVAELEQRQAPAELVTVADFATSRSLGVSTVRQMIREGRLAAVKFGRSVRVPANAEIACTVAQRDPKPETAQGFAMRVLAGGGGER